MLVISLIVAGRRVEPAELVRRLQQKKEASGQDVEVRVRAARTVPYQFVEPILLSCVRAGIWNLTYAVYRRGDVR